MSRPKFWWYRNVEQVVKNYPMLRQRKKEKQAQSVVADYSGMPRAGGANRKTESVALRQLSPREESDLAAVEDAIELLGRDELGREILLVVEYYHWRGIRNFDEVAYLLHMSRRTCERRNSRFIYEVARNLGYC